MLEYRKADVIDAEALAKIRTDFHCEVHNITGDAETRLLFENNHAYFKDTLPDGSFIGWLALDDGEIIACSGISFYRFPPNVKNPAGMAAYISNMYTRPQHRKKGIATRLFELLLEEARNHCCGKIWLYATEMGRPIYKKFGLTDSAGDMVCYVKY